MQADNVELYTFMNRSQTRIALGALAAMIFLASACSGSQKRADKTPKAPPVPSMQVANLGPKTVAYAVVPNLQATVERFESMVTQLDGNQRSPLLPEVITELSGMAGWTNVNGTAFDKPMGVLLLDTKPGLEPNDVAIFFSIKDEQAFVNQFDGAQAGPGGNAHIFTSYTIPGGNGYINFIDDKAVITADVETFAIYKGAVETLAKSNANGQDMLLGLELGNYMANHKAEVDQSLAGLRQMMAMFSPPGVGGNTDSAFDMLDVFLNDTDRMEVGVTFNPDSVTVESLMAFKDGTTAARFLKEQPVANTDILKGMPGDAAILMSGGINFNAADGAMSKFVIRMTASMFPPEVLEDPEFQSAFNESFAQLDSSMATVFTGTEGQMPSLIGGYAQIYTVKDTDKYRAAYRKMSQFYTRPDVANTLVSSMGMTTTFTPDAYKIGDVTVDRLTMTFDPAKAQDPNMAMGLQLMGMTEPINTDIACVNKRCYTVIDADPRPALTNLLKTNNKAQPKLSPNVAVAAKRALASPTLFMYFSYDGLGRMLGGFGGPSPFETFAPNQGADFSLSARGRFLMTRLNIPLKGKAAAQAQ